MGEKSGERAARPLRAVVRSMDMKHAQAQSAVLWIQTLGLLGIVALSWLDEWAQLPARLFGGTPQAPNWRESTMETLVVVVVWLVTLPISRRLVRRLRYLE